jgi:GxxExxY protein
MAGRRGQRVGWKNQRLCKKQTRIERIRLMEPTNAGAPRELLHRDLTRSILGAFYSVFSEVGYGFLEAVYANSLSLVPQRAGFQVERQASYNVMFRGSCVGTYRADLVVDSRVIVQVKAGSSIVPQHLLQLRNYLAATGLQVGLLLNFGPKPEFRRVVWTRNDPPIRPIRLIRVCFCPNRPSLRAFAPLS